MFNLHHRTHPPRHLSVAVALTFYLALFSPIYTLASLVAGVRSLLSDNNAGLMLLFEEEGDEETERKKERKKRKR